MKAEKDMGEILAQLQGDFAKQVSNSVPIPLKEVSKKSIPPF